jgi:nitroimidazol reductase NimA-like FMN-containing flavoprotein (pyridoxamine 5'-phosphate oxidase superfamily)
VLGQPLTARVATCGDHGATVRPVWFRWEEGAFWWLTGPWAALPRHLERDPRVALVVDTCDLATGEVIQVVARGSAEQRPHDVERARCMLTKYLGPHESRWDPARFGMSKADQRAWFVRLEPESLTARDLSYRPAPAAPPVPPGG